MARNILVIYNYTSLHFTSSICSLKRRP